MTIGKTRKRRKRRVTAVYFRSDEEFAEVRAAAQKAGLPFTRLIRDAALREAKKLLAA
jgi:hypothetical protein